MAAALRREAEVAMGNVIGSNMANLLGIIGISALFGEIPVSDGVLRFDLPVMIAASLLLVPFVLMRMNISRLWGLFFVGLYIGYVVTVLH